MLSNAYFLAKFRFDTAENEPTENLQKFANFADPNPLTGSPLQRWQRILQQPAARQSSGGTSSTGGCATVRLHEIETLHVELHEMNEVHGSIDIDRGNSQRSIIQRCRK